jgi:hypothetical protein
MDKATLTTLATFIGAASLLFSSSHAVAAPMNQVSEAIAVESRQGKVLVHVTITNRGARTVYVPNTVAADKELFGRVFAVRDAASGAALEYIGPMVKRGPLTRDDYVAVKPRGKHSNTIDITRSYAFLPGKHTYQLSHAADYFADLERLAMPEAAAGTLQAGPVLFTYASG